MSLRWNWINPSYQPSTWWSCGGKHLRAKTYPSIQVSENSLSSLVPKNSPSRRTVPKTVFDIQGIYIYISHDDYTKHMFLVCIACFFWGFHWSIWIPWFDESNTYNPFHKIESKIEDMVFTKLNLKLNLKLNGFHKIESKIESKIEWFSQNWI